MDAKIILAVAIIAAIAGALFFTLNNHAVVTTATTANNDIQNSSASGSQPNSSNQLFASTQYASYSYLVFPGTLSPQAHAALSGFNLTAIALQNGTSQVTLMVTGTSQRQSYLLKPGYKLYVIETSFGDDSRSFDSSLGDDGFVAVDQNGYVVQ